MTRLATVNARSSVLIFELIRPKRHDNYEETLAKACIVVLGRRQRAFDYQRRGSLLGI